MGDTKDVDAVGEIFSLEEREEREWLKSEEAQRTNSVNQLVHSDPCRIQSLVLQGLERRYNRSGWMLLANILISWQKSALYPHLEFRIQCPVLDIDCRQLISVRNSKTEVPELYAFELIENTTLRETRRKVETQLILNQVNKIMGDSSTRAWWLPIIEERVRQNTLRQAQMINSTFHGLANLDLATKESLGGLINQGEIDGALLLDLTTSAGDLDSQHGDMDTTESAPTRSLSDATYGTGSQPILDVSKEELSKRNLKNKRKKEKKRARFAAKYDHQARASAPDDPIITSQDTPTVSTGPDNISQDSTITKTNSSVAPESYHDSNGNDAIAGPITSATSTEPDRIPNAFDTTQNDVPVSAKSILVSGDYDDHEPESNPPTSSDGLFKDDDIAKVEYLASPEVVHGVFQDPVSPDIHLDTPPLLADNHEDIVSAKLKDLTISSGSHGVLHDTSSLELPLTTPNSFDISPNNSDSSHPENSTSDYSGPTQESLVDVAEERTDAMIEGSTDSGDEGSVGDTTEEISDDSCEELTENEDNSNFATLPPEPVSGAMGLQWAYATHTSADDLLLSSGTWLFEAPPDHFHYQPYVWRRHGLGIEQAPVVIDSLGGSTKTPGAEFDNQVLSIDNHTVPWNDLRTNISHPDLLPETKLVEYQAAESIGLNVWRHDRDLLDCRFLRCHAKVADHNPASVVCLGCGPKTMVRYCSVEHMVADLHEHWQECGHRDLVIKRVVDHSTAPVRFNRLCPATRDSHNNKCYALYRQATHVMLNFGRYTLFDFETEEPTVLVWTTEDTNKTEMERRVERLLNLALFDQRNKVMIGFLFRLLRQCLQLKHCWALGTSHALKKQFLEEFGLDASEVREDLVCECEWAGEGLPEKYHLPTCRRLYRLFGQAFHATGMQGYLEMYEDRYWILRAWQQQHPTVRHWRDRAAGRGFPGAPETVPVLGPGWTGWGADQCDMHD